MTEQEEMEVIAAIGKCMGAFLAMGVFFIVVAEVASFYLGG